MEKSTTTKKPESLCPAEGCGQYGKCNPEVGCNCDALFDGIKCQKCLVPGHYFPMCNKTATPIEKPVNSNRAKVTYVWGLLGRQTGATSQYDEKSIRTVYYDKFDISHVAAQSSILNLCNKLRARPDLVQPKSEHCFMATFKEWIEENKGLTFPIEAENQFLPHLVEFIDSKVGKKFGNDVGFDNVKSPSRVKFAAISFLTNLRPYESGFSSLESYQEFKNLQQDVNDIGNTQLGKVLLVSELWPRMFTELIAVIGTMFGIGLTSTIALLSIWMFTGTIRGALLSLMSLLGVLSVVLGAFFLLDWKLGIVEAISVSILLGSAIDYPAHVLEAYVITRPSSGNSIAGSDIAHQRRVDRIRRAVRHIGPSIVNASATTVFSVFSLLFCTIEVFKKVGEILVLSCSVSIIYSLAPLVAILFLKGPKYQERTFASASKTIALIFVVIGILLVTYTLIKQVALNDGKRNSVDLLFGL